MNDEGLIGLLVLLGISVVVAAAWHSRSTAYLRTSLLSGVVSSGLFIALVIARGDRDPFIAIAAVGAAFYGIVVALIVGLPFLIVRRSRSARSAG